MENDATESGQPLSEEERAERVRKLEEEIRALRTDDRGPETGAGITEHDLEPDSVATDLVQPLSLMQQADREADKLPKPSPADREKAEMLCQRFQLELSRGNKDFSERYLKEAVETAPGLSLVVECQGDMARFNRSIQAAGKLYRIAKALDPSNKSADSKLAELAFSDARGAVALASLTESTANTKAATIMTVILPGAGQMVLGAYIVGAAFLIAYAGCWYFMAGAMKGFSEMMANRATEVTGLWPAFAAFVVWLFAIIDMNVRTKSKVSFEQAMGLAKEANRPGPVRPPVDLPYE